MQGGPRLGYAHLPREPDGGGHGGKKAVDADIPLIPFIDLLLCCVMFLLVSAVWTNLASLQANQHIEGGAIDQPPATEVERLIEAFDRVL